MQQTPSPQGRVPASSITRGKLQEKFVRTNRRRPVHFCVPIGHLHFPVTTMPLQLTVNSRGYIKGANFPLQVNLPDDATLSMLKNGLAHLVPQLTLDRQRITDAEKKPLVGDDKRLTDLNVKSGDALQVKDLGPQISWRTVFLVEYVRENSSRSLGRCSSTRSSTCWPPRCGVTLAAPSRCRACKSAYRIANAESRSSWC